MVAGDKIEKMLTPRPHTLNIAGWPTTSDALAWSADASIAIALDEYVELFIPKIDLKHLTSDSSIFGPQPSTTNITTTSQQSRSPGQSQPTLELEHWHRLRLQTNTFTVAEWPYLEGQLLEDFDVGEEQGSGGVAALEWSSPGLGRFGRCALGVLTANGVLSIWADGGRVREEGERGWKRRAIVGTVLRKEFEKQMGMGPEASGESMVVDAIGDVATKADDASTADGTLTGSIATLANGAMPANGGTYESGPNNDADAMQVDLLLPLGQIDDHSTTQAEEAQASDNKKKLKEQTPTEKHARAKKSAILYKRCRIRSFCWTQVPRDISHLPQNLKNQAMEECTNHLLIVTNDYEEIIVLHVRSPYDNPISPSEWSIKVVSIIDTKTKVMQEPAGPQLFRLKRGLHSISINEWTTEQGKDELWTAFVAYGKDHGLEVMKCKISYVRDEIVLQADREHVLSMSDCDVVGPMRWSPELNAKEMDELFVPERGSLVNLAFHHARPPTEYELGCTQIRDNWSSIAASTITLDEEPGYQRLHYTPHMPSGGDIYAKSQSWSMSSIHDQTSEAVWLNALHQHGDEFNDAYELFGHVDYRVWGMASAPDRRHIAAYYSLHPSDMNQYVTHSQQVSFVCFSDELKGAVPKVSSDRSTEANMFTLSTWLREGEELEEAPQDRLRRLESSLLNAAQNPLSKPQIAEVQMLISETADLQSLVLAVRSGMISTQRLYSRLTRALHSLTSGNRFGQIQGYFQDEDQKTNMLELISAAIEKVPNRTELSLTILEMWKSAAMPPVFIHGFEQSNSAGLLHEQCELCNAHILFETTAEASCQNGHQFTRCALTLLTIQEPGISKFCAICNAQYYREDVLLAKERQQAKSTAEVSTDSALTMDDVSLAQLLSLAVDRCLFCGGKFTI